jgi:hypothetical protein
MPKVLDPFRFLLIAPSGRMNQRQLQVIDYLREENRVLREQLGIVGCGSTTTSAVAWRPEPSHLTKTGMVQQHQRLGGLLNYYYRRQPEWVKFEYSDHTRAGCYLPRACCFIFASSAVASCETAVTLGKSSRKKLCVFCRPPSESV